MSPRDDTHHKEDTLMKTPYTKIRGSLNLSAAVLTFLSAALLSACGGGGGGNGNNTDTTDVSSGSRTNTARAAQSVFIRASETGRPLLFSVADDGGTQPVTLASSNLFSAIGQFVLSPDKRYLAFIADGSLYIVKGDGSGLMRLSQLNNAAGKVTDFEWSPDGSSLVYLADGEVTDRYELYQVKSDGSDRDEKRRISGSLGSKTTLDIAEPQWSPDGRYVAYLVEDAGRAIGLNTHDTTSTDPRDSVRVSNPTAFASWQDIAGYGNVGYLWSPDSHYLAYRSDVLKDKLYEIFTVHPDGSELRRANSATAGIVYIDAYAWSPDSRYLAETIRDMLNSAYVGLNTWDVQDSSGVPSRRIASASHFNGFAWAHHAAKLAFVDDHEATGIYELFVHDPQTASIVKVNHGGPSGDLIKEFNWSPDDGFLGYDTLSGIYLAVSGSSDPSQALYTYDLGESIFGHWVWSPNDQQVGYWVNNASGGSGADQKLNLYISETAAPANTFLALGPRPITTEIPVMQWSDDSKVLVTKIDSAIYGLTGVMDYSLSASYRPLGFVY